MNVMPSLSSFYSNFVNQEAKNTQQQYSVAGSSRQSSANAGAVTNAIKEAQSASAQDAQTDAEIAREDAVAINELAKNGMTLKSGSFASLYKNEVMAETDQNGDGTISLSELEQQVVAGGGTDAQAGSMYKAMDENGDGSVSAQEFEDSLPNPFITADFIQQMKAMVEQFQKGASPNGSIVVEPPESKPIPVDAGLVLGSLAMELDSGSRSSNSGNGQSNSSSHVS
ncbi:hypothetical protein R69619_01231 [Paraburkholderia nemoris]|uniref:EF-hand domain-containing protein n=1 Tax=Paraburkholderia nemoris TaxID=2793076 RepID=UPI00190D6D6C|nr:EF-hand domain-containing protein [Paraburkholderia nemoris]MBK3739961.1 EF-hand domain-containing protein [Paraburkholderia aspalathi]CAE6714228.1 hypothetical protein R69619_01231 [Paraburkholderia nemoris]